MTAERDDDGDLGEDDEVTHQQLANVAEINELRADIEATDDPILRLAKIEQYHAELERR